MSVKVPVTIIIFNRPDAIKTLINSLKNYSPEVIFVIADGAREQNQDDHELCDLARRKIDELIDWKCKIYKNYADTNLGLGLRVKTGLDWVFSQTKCSIILEDDCVPAIPFYYFCEELLNRYKDDTRIMHISGNNYTPKYNPNNLSYFFSLYGHIWGWATWARAWQLMDYDMKKWEIEKNRIAIKSLFKNNEFKYFERIFDEYHLNEKKPWGQRWFYSRLLNKGLSIVPKSNLVTNIGTVGTHSDKRSDTHFRPIDDKYTINVHPENIETNKYYDENHFKKHISKKRSLIKKIISKFMKHLAI